jgi:hypothetical protein
MSAQNRITQYSQCSAVLCDIFSEAPLKMKPFPSAFIFRAAAEGAWVPSPPKPQERIQEQPHPSSSKICVMSVLPMVSKSSGIAI